MNSITIQRCPVCPNIKNHASSIAESLRNQRQIAVQIVDGDKGEFNVLMNGTSVIHKSGDALPTPKQVERAVAAVVTQGAT